MEVRSFSTIAGPALRSIAVSAAVLALLGAQGQSVDARSALADAGSGALVGTEPLGPTLPASIGDAERYRGATGAGTKGKTKNGSRSGTGSASKAKGSATGTNSASKGATKPAGRGGTKPGTGTNGTAGSGTGSVGPTNTQEPGQGPTGTTGGNNNAGNNDRGNAGGGNAGGGNPGGGNAGGGNAGGGNPGGGSTGGSPGSSTTANPGATLGQQAGPAPAPAGQAVLGIQQLPSTATVPPAQLPSGTIALLGLGSALYAIRRKSAR